MDLWIRSQDKKSLTKVSNVEYIYKKGDLYTDVSGKHYIGTYYDNLKILGAYETKERALEVLDEINEHIEKQGQTIAITNEKGIVDGLKYYGKTYVMPEE